jgi:dGTPase
LTEAIALGHDIGHTPFGHAGEDTLDTLLPEGFSHYEQSLRVVEKLESTDRGPGLNLTHEVRDGILNHSRDKGILESKRSEGAYTLEAQIMVGQNHSLSLSP